MGTEDLISTNKGIRPLRRQFLKTVMALPVAGALGTLTNIQNALSQQKPDRKEEPA